jgi:hypothetical protein
MIGFSRLALVASVMKRCLPHIRRTDYVKKYEAKILGTGTTR